MNKKSYLSRVRLPRTPADWLEAVMNFIFFLCGMLAVMNLPTIIRTTQESLKTVPQGYREGARRQPCH